MNKNMQQIGSFLDFYTQLKSRSYWADTPNARANNSSGVDTTLSKDTDFHLCIFGEANSGKSALIDALLQQNVLKKDSKSGTTCVPTFIRYGESFNVIVEFNNRSPIKLRMDGASQDSAENINFQAASIRYFIDQYTANDTYTSSVDKVTILLNNPILKNGLVLVDTPAITDAYTKREKTLQELVQKYCDVALITTPSNWCCSDILCNFIKKNLQEKRCWGCVTKKDLIQYDSQLEMLFQSTNTTFENLLGKSLESTIVTSTTDFQALKQLVSGLNSIQTIETPKMEPTEDDSLDGRIELLRRRINDKDSLYLGIVGEFSAGKSTLINAILHQKNLLKEDPIQGTTCAPTFIRYGKAFDITIDYIDGKQAKLKDSGSYNVYTWSNQPIDFQSGPVRDFIDKYTATEKYSAQVDKVTIYLDNPILQKGLVIVDTPGINAENPRHSVVTKQTIKKYCDATMILTPANAPCSETICKFVRENLHGVVGSCIGVVSKIDSLRRISEQDTQVQFVKDRFKSEFGKPFSAVLPVSAIFSDGVESEDTPRVKPEMLPRYKQMFDDFESTISNRLIQGRDSILFRSMRQSVLDIISQLQKQLEPLQKKLKTQQENLANNQLSDFSAWYNNLVNIYQENFRAIDNSISLQEPYDSACQYVCNTLERDLLNCSSRSDIENVANNLLVKRCNEAQDKVIRYLRDCQDKFARWGSNSCKDFQRNFANEFRNLSKDSVLSPSENTALTNISADVHNLDISFGGENFFRTTGYIISGILGGLIGVGIFTLVDWLFFNLDSARADTWDKMCPILEKFMESLRELTNNSYTKMNKQSWSSVFNYTDEMRCKYEPIIHNIIQKERNDIVRLKNQQEQLENDLKQIHSYENSCTEF